ncbi:MAG: S41 family peptidase [Pseudomonadota bacterium]
MYRRIFLTLTALSLACAGSAGADTTNWDEIVPVTSLRADFAALYAGLRSAHANLYVHRDKARYDALYDTMRLELEEPLSLFEAHVRFQKFVAFGNVAHARIDFPYEVYQAFEDQGGRSFPIYLRIAKGRAYVGEDYSGNADVQPGDRIVALNDLPIKDWLRRTAAHISADTDYIAHSLLEFSFPRHLWLELGEVAEFELELKTREGARKSVTIAARSAAERRQHADEQAAASAPDRSLRAFELLDDNIAYLRPGPFYNAEDPNAIWDNTAFLAFIDSAFETFLDARADTLIIDLRENPGGDNSFSDPMLAWIADEPFRFYSEFLIRSSDEAAASNQARLDGNPAAAESVSRLMAERYAEVPRGESFAFEIPFAEPRKGPRFDGEVYVLINRHSYSNTVNVAAIVQDYGLGTVVGEKTSDMATTYGAMETFTLPHTGFTVGFPKAHIIRPSGERRADGVSPDWPIESPLVPTGEDPMLDSLVQRLRAR